ncbi:MAG TPA: hypothetical protein VF615_03095 [Longimicrobiaceae bacterium]|jgi:hypothetical protein
MSILDYFRRDPTHDWPECRPVPLVYDLARRELNGIPEGAPVERLRALGRPGNRKPSWIGIFAYPRLGIQVHLGADHVRSVACVFQANAANTEIEGHPDFRPCAIELRTGGGERVRVTADTRRDEIERRFGPLALDAPEPALPILRADVDGVWLDFEFGSDGRLRILDIEPEPPGES